jgi:hypothetical protein
VVRAGGKMKIYRVALAQVNETKFSAVRNSAHLQSPMPMACQSFRGLL